ncbi:MAG: hypothetical protein JST92_13630 [Deltaproteobacteria bacterium]|nr:hypothetical protein [Deltaproteobacteria bacterium]
MALAAAVSVPARAQDDDEDEERREALLGAGPSHPTQASERGEPGAVTLRVHDGKATRVCTGALLAANGASTMVVAPAACVGKARPADIEVELAGERSRADLRADEPGKAGWVALDVPLAPARAIPLMLLEPDAGTLAQLAHREVTVLTAGEAGLTARKGALRDGVVQGCQPSAAASLLTVFIPPQAYLLGVLAPKGCKLDAAAQAASRRQWLHRAVPGVDPKLCQRDAKTGHVSCGDLGRKLAEEKQ